jgi:hypothetical protein
MTCYAAMSYTNLRRNNNCKPIYNSDPVWDADTAFWADEAHQSHYKLTFDVYDHDHGDKSEIIGTCRLDGKELLSAVHTAAAATPVVSSPTVSVSVGENKEEKKALGRTVSMVTPAHVKQFAVWIQLEPQHAKVYYTIPYHIIIT